jgi:hypothetical protein
MAWMVADPIAALAMPFSVRQGHPELKSGAEATLAEPVKGGGPIQLWAKCSRLAQLPPTQQQAARRAFLTWLQDSQGNLTLLEEGGPVQVRFRLDRWHKVLEFAAKGGWHTITVNLPRSAE